ncbi:MAG: TonB-dependent siderophore receptor [Cellvibrionales bacterium]|nr:TonB-dependent siderophore receptor [Cellvibrionales bacterium]
MPPRNRPRLPATLGAITLALTAAPTLPAEERVQMEEMRITGQYLSIERLNSIKTPTPIIDVPQSLSIMTAEQIARQGFTSIGQIVDYTPGLNSSQGEGHRDAVVFRGVRSTADFFIDGARDDVQYYRPLYNLEQVEVLRGPNALLFGRGGTGGVLNRVTKKGILGENRTTYRIGTDSLGELGTYIDNNIALSDSAALRVNAMFETLKNHRDHYAGDRIGFNPTMRLQFGPHSTLDLNYEYIDHQRFIDRGIPTGTDGRPVPAFAKTVFADPELNTSELQAYLLRAALEHRFGDNLKGNISLFYGDYDKRYQNFYVSNYNQTTAPDKVTLDGYLDTTRRQNTLISGNLIGEFNTGELGHTLVAGIEYIDTSSEQDRHNALWSTTNKDKETFTIARPLALRGGIGINAAGQATTNDFTRDLHDDTHVNIDALSFYIQDELAISEKLDLVIGARFDSFDIEVFNVKTNETRNRKDSEVSPRFGIIFKPKENVSLYASHSESFLPRSGEQFSDINGDKNKLDPDTFANRELGIKWDLPQGLSLTAALFEISKNSPQTADNDPATLDIIESKIDGFETQLQGHLTDRWSLAASYSYLDGKHVERSGPTGNRPRELPKNTLALWSSYQLTDQLGLAAGLVYQDESFIDNANTAALPSYTRLDLAAHYDLSARIRLQLNIENLTDKLYFPNAHSTHQATVGTPLNALFSLSGRF